MWIQVPNYLNYEVSDKGEIRNVNTGRILKLKPNERGYYYTNLSNESKYKTFRIHRLVAELFIPNPENKPEVNHKDGDKSNNSVDNLEWVTRRENKQHAYKLGLEKPPTPVVQYSLEGNYIQKFDSITQAAFHVSVDTTRIRKVCEGKAKYAKGYVWRYE